jgi:hypothetical protein
MGWVEALSFAVYPSNYKHDMNAKWIFPCQGFNMPIQDYINLFNCLRILLNIFDSSENLFLNLKASCKNIYTENLITWKSPPLIMHTINWLKRSSGSNHTSTISKHAPPTSIGSLSSSSSSFSSFTKFCKHCKKHGHDKSTCFQLRKKTLILQSSIEEDMDAPTEVSGEDNIYDELKGQLNKVTLLQQSTPQTNQYILFITHAHLSHNFLIVSILDNGSQYNLISNSIVDMLHL